MPPRDPNLPEGTDSIIDGTSEFGSSAGLGTSGGIGLGGSGGSLDRDDFGSEGLGGGFSGGIASGATSGSDMSAGGSAAFSVANSSTVQSLKSQASDKVRDVAMQGKERATEALGNVTQLINDTAQTVDERLGPQYGDYVRRAATAIEGFGDSLQGKEVDELFDDARNFVRQSPGVALGAAAAVGFLLVRLVKSGMPGEVGSDDYRSKNTYAGGGTQRLASPPRVDNSFDPVA